MSHDDAKMAETVKSSLQPQFQVTHQIRQIIEQALKCKCLKDDLKIQCSEILRQDNETARISTKLIKETYYTLREDGHTVNLHDIVKDAQFIPQQVTLPPRDPQLEARIQKLRIKQENKEYRRMTRNVDSRAKQTFTFQEEVKGMNRQIIAMINFIITVAAGFAFGYKGAEMVVGKLFAFQMMTGLVLGTVVFFVDLYFLLRYGF